MFHHWGNRAVKLLCPGRVVLCPGRVVLCTDRTMTLTCCVLIGMCPGSPDRNVLCPDRNLLWCNHTCCVLIGIYRALIIKRRVLIATSCTLIVTCRAMIYWRKRRSYLAYFEDGRHETRVNWAWGGWWDWFFQIRKSCFALLVRSPWWPW